MANFPDKSKFSPKKSKISSEKYARLKAEAQAPYKGLRKTLYLVCGASGLIGALIFLLKIVAGTGSQESLPNLALQLGVVGIVIALWQFER